MTLSNIIAETGQSEKVLIYTLIGGHVVTLLTLLIKAAIDQANRVQDRLDAELKAKTILAEGAKREQRIVGKIDENTEVNLKQIEISNGHNEKIANLTETVAKAVGETVKPPQEIHVTIDNNQ